MADTPSKRRLPLRVVSTNTPDAQRRRGEDGKAVGKQKESYSREVLTKCGIFLDIDGEGTCVCNEVVRSRLMLGQILQQQSHRAAEFVGQIAEYWADDKKLLASLRPLDVEGVQTGSLHTKSYLDSFAKMLLRIQPIQSMVIDVLIERMTTLAATVSEPSLSQDHPCALILLHLRYLDMIHDPSSLTNKLLEVLDACPRALQIEILMAIPEVVVSADYPVVLEKYEELLLSEAELGATILDSITNLCLPPAMLRGPSELALQMLESAEHVQVPPLVRFLLEICGPENAVNIIEQVRQNLCSLVALPLDDDEARSSVSMVVDILRGSFQFREVISKAYFKVLDKDASQTLLPVDYWILFSLFDLVKFRTKVLAIFNKRSANRRQTKQSLAEALLPGANALGSLFQAMLSAAQSMLATGVSLSGAPPRAHWLGELLYLNLYNTYRSGFQRQEIIVALVGHAATGAPHEITNALRILKTISDQQAGNGDDDETYIDQPAEQPFSSFIPFLKVLLDSVQRFTHEQLRMLFDIIFRTAAAEHHVGDDVVIFLKKLLASTRVDMRKIGALGSVSLMCCRSPVDNDHADDVSRSSLSQLSQELLLPKYRNGSKRAGNPRPYHADYAESVFASVSDAPECFTFLIDELSLAIAERRMTDLTFVRWLFDRFSAELMTTFISDPDRAAAGGNSTTSATTTTTSSSSSRTPSPKSGYLFMGGALKGTLQLGLTGEKHPDACVRLLPVATLRNEEDRHLLTYLAPVLRLVLQCAQALSKCSPELLENLAPILTAPLLLPEEQAFVEIDALSPEIRVVMCLCLKHSVDWLRELVNCFVEQEMDNKQALVLRRLEHLSELETLLIDMTMRHPTYLRSLHPPVDHEMLFVKAPKPAPKGKRKAAAMTGDQAEESAAAAASSSSTAAADEAQAATKNLVGKEAAKQLIEQSARPLNPTAVLALGFNNAIRKHRNERGLTQGEERVPVSLPILTMLLCHFDEHLSKKKQSGDTVAFVNKLVDANVFQRIHGFLRESIDALAGDAHESVLQSEIVDVEDLWSPLRATLGIVTRTVGLLSAEDTAAAMDAHDDQVLHTSLVRLVAQLANFPVNASDPQLADVQRSFGSCFDLLASLGPASKSLEFAVDLVKCLETLIRAFLKACAHTSDEITSADTQALTARLSELCDDLLKRDWIDPTGRRRYTQKDLGYIVKTHLDWAPRPLERLQILSQDVLPELLETVNSVGPVDAYPTITAASFVCYFVPLFETLIDCWKKVTGASSTEGASPESDDEDDQPVVARMSRLVSVFESLVKFTRGNAVLETKAVLSAALREGRKFIDAFLKSRPVLSAAFKTHQDDVLVMFRVLQGSTRQIQSVCAHGKVLKDAAMSREAPAIKKALEQLIFEVKQMAKENSCLKALWVGNLKHRNIDGTEARESEDEDDDDEEEEQYQSEAEADSDSAGEKSDDE